MKCGFKFYNALEIANKFLSEMNPSLWDGKGNMPDEEIHPWLWEEEVNELAENNLCLNICIADGWVEDYRVYVEIVNKKDYSVVKQLSTEIINSEYEIANLIMQLLNERRIKNV